MVILMRLVGRHYQKISNDIAAKGDWRLEKLDAPIAIIPIIG